MKLLYSYDMGKNCIDIEGATGCSVKAWLHDPNIRDGNEGKNN